MKNSVFWRTLVAKSRRFRPTTTFESLLHQTFDGRFYLNQYKDVKASNIHPLVHFELFGWRENRKPNKWFFPESHLAENPDLDPHVTNPYRHFLQEIIRDYHDNWAAQAKAIRPDNPESVEKPQLADVAVVKCAFDPQFYAQQVPELANKGIDPLLHFMTVGWKQRLNPSPDFSFDYYVSKNRDMAELNRNAYVHYLKHGKLSKWHTSLTVAEAAHQYLFDHNEEMIKRVNDAFELEPMIGFPQGKRKLTSPFQNKKDQAKAGYDMRTRIGDKTYKYVVVLSHIRMSGAARVASVVFRSLSELHGQDNVLVVTTENSDVEYDHWFPDGFSFLPMGQLTENLTDLEKMTCLYDLLRGIECRTVVNVNSRILWQALEVYGRQLSQDFNIVSYLFTWDVAASGARLGFPINRLRHSTQAHHLLLTDNERLSQELRDRFGFDGQEGRTEVKTLYTVAEQTDILAGQPDPDAPLKVMWASRFDPQKRVDVLMEIARQNPHIQFDVYGKSVLDNKPLSAFDPPTNVIDMGPYSDLREVLKTPYSAYLYTSQWDGIPTVLLDIGQTGLPVVASNVGGINEVVNNDTGWLVQDFDDASQYTDALEEITRNRDEARRRATNMRTKILDQFSQESYHSALKQVLDKYDL